jgi:hypothetical protein
MATNKALITQTVSIKHLTVPLSFLLCPHCQPMSYSAGKCKNIKFFIILITVSQMDKNLPSPPKKYAV